MLALPSDDELLEELANIRLRESAPGMAPRMDHDASGHNDRVIAIALAAHSLMSNPPQVLKVYDRRRYDPDRSPEPWEPKPKPPGGEREAIKQALERIAERVRYAR